MDYEKYWHSSAHILAAAVKKLWPKIKLGIGPAIENGFYYEFYGKKFTKDDLKKIEKEMRKMISEKLKFERRDLKRTEAKKMFKNEPFKLELLEEMGAPSIYTTGDFVDLCKGPHVNNTGNIKEVKLLKISASYWKGDNKRESLQRIYGISFNSKKEIRQFTHMMEEAIKRDHRKIGKEMELFGFNELVSPGFSLMYPNGTVIMEELRKFINQINKEMGFKNVWTPHVAKTELWKISGHYEAYREKMYMFKSGKNQMAIKPMNCPFHVQIYKRKRRSYKELPIRYSEIATVYRNEQSGELHGLMRVITINMDDRHSFVKSDQIESEIKMLMNSVKKVIDIFGMKAVFNLSTRPKKRIGSDEVWDKAEKTLKDVLEKNKINYILKEGEGAFYGPKVDVDAMDAIGRKWQLSTIQLDLSMPERFDLDYLTNKGKERPAMIHCAILGSVERLMGILIEHYAGKFPVWLSPIQAMVLPITDRNVKYAEKVNEELKKSGIRSEINRSQNTLQYKIRDAQTKMKIPYLIIVGDKELEKKKLAVRDRSNKTKYNVSTKQLIKEIREKIDKRSE